MEKEGCSLEHYYHRQVRKLSGGCGARVSHRLRKSSGSYFVVVDAMRNSYYAEAHQGSSGETGGWHDCIILRRRGAIHGTIGRVVCRTHMQVEPTCAKRPGGCKLELRPRVVTAAALSRQDQRLRRYLTNCGCYARIMDACRRLQALLDNSIQQEAFNLLGQGL